jgi:CDP-glycerol glycerophosphotransferase (TagB/SpsB family)
MFSSKNAVYIDFVTPEEGVFIIEGYLGGVPVRLQELVLTVGGLSLVITHVPRNQSQENIELTKPVPGTTFKAELGIGSIDSKSSSLKAYYRGIRIPIRFNRFVGIGGLAFTQKVIGGYRWLSNPLGVYISKSSRRSAINELMTVFSILFDYRLRLSYLKIKNSSSYKKALFQLIKSFARITESIASIPYSTSIRLTHTLGPRNSRPIWIISDRPTAAGDNGEAYYNYLLSKKVDANVYFALSKSSKDWDRLKGPFQMIDFGSLKYKLLFIRSELIISSHADEETINPFGRMGNRFNDLFSFKFVFLQHGVIRHDLSAWLNRFNRNIDLFITSSDNEKESIMKNPYYYHDNQVVVTGLPRFDLLKPIANKKIIIMPTYRASLLKTGTNRLGRRGYDLTFKDSGFFIFYDELISNQGFRDALKKYGYKAELYLHPVFAAQTKDFTGNSRVKVMDFPHDYNRAINEGSLLVSDHSSVMFDFAYLKKPIIYAHFDNKDFYKSHIYTKSTFFDDDKHGFGKICKDQVTLLNALEEVLVSGCKMSNKYSSRVESYFKYNDSNNSKRVHDSIQNLMRNN